MGLPAVITICNYGILASTLFTFQNNACDNQKLHIRCPHETTINIQWAQYGRQVPSAEMCPYPGMNWPPDKNNVGKEDIKCLAPKSLDIVIEKCQDKRQCKIHASANVFGGDPCPGTSKYLEVSYKCRPNEFRSRVECEGGNMNIRCQKSKKIAIYSATFGRSERGIRECPNTPGVPNEECQAQCSQEVVMKKCHGQRRCEVPVTEAEFGNPCGPRTAKYLTVVYTCVSRRILRVMKDDEAYPFEFCDDGQPIDSNGKPIDNNGQPISPTDETVLNITSKPDDSAPGLAPKHSTMYPKFTYPPEFVGPSENTPAYNSSWNDTEDPESAEVQENYFGFVMDWISTWQYIKDNKERVILYSVIGLLTGIILLLLVIIIRLKVVKRRKSSRSAKLEISSPHENSSPSSRPEDMTLLPGDSTDHNDGIEMLSFQNQSTFNRQTHSPPFTHRTSSLQRYDNSRRFDNSRYDTGTNGGGTLPPTYSNDNGRFDDVDANLNYEQNTGTLGSRTFDNYYR